MIKIRIPQGAQSIIDTLKAAGYEAYIIGGCVRDSMLGLDPKDWDICTSAIPSQILYSFRDKRVIETGLKHGTVTVVMDDGQYEVTTFRIDGDYSDSRHPDSVKFVSNIEDDLARRDFTINAMAYNDDGLVDPFNGRKDLVCGLISCVGNPDDRFGEDALRILRAMRFAAIYGFDIEDVTAKSIHQNKEKLLNIAAERIQSELCKMLAGEGILEVLLDYGDVMATIIPELKPCIGFDQNNRFHEFTIYDHIAHAVSNCDTTDPVVNMSLLLHDIGKPRCYTEDHNGGHFYGHGVHSHDLAKEVLTRLRFDNKSRDDILELVLYHDAVIEPSPKTVRRWLNKIGKKQFMRLVDIRMADILAHKKDTQESRIDRCIAIAMMASDIIEENQCFKLKDLVVDGHDVMNLCDVKEGKDVGRILNEVLDAVISGELENERTAIVKYLIMKGWSVSYEQKS